MKTTFNAGLAYAEYNQRKGAYIIAALVAFVMSSYFVVGYLAGDLLFWDWDISQTMNGCVGVGICAVMTSYQFILYSQGDISGGRKATIVAVCVAVGFSLLSEVGQGMERDHIRMETKSVESPTYKAIVGKISNSTGGATSHPYSLDLQNAKMKLARCKQKVTAGEWDDCIESAARLDSVNEMISNHYSQGEKQITRLSETAKTMEKDESNYHPLVNLIRGTLSSTGVFASFILSLILISFFEYAFHYLGRQLAAKKIELLNHGYDVTRRKRKTPRKTQANEEAQPPFPTDKTWNDQLSKSGIDSPHDSAMNQTDNDEQAQRIVERAKSVPDKAGSVQGTLTDKPGGTLSDADKQRIFKKVYSGIKRLVIAGQVKPTVRPVTDAVTTSIRVNHEILNIKPSWFTKPERQAIAQTVLERLEQDGIVNINKEGGVGKPKYVLSPEYIEKATGEMITA